MFKPPSSTPVRGLLRCVRQDFFIPTFEEEGYHTLADLRLVGVDDATSFIDALGMQIDSRDRFLEFAFGDGIGDDPASAQDDHPPIVDNPQVAGVGRMMDANWMKIVEPLYSMNMGCENMGPLLYSILRFAKPKICLEIGAGYTTAFLLQALEDNQSEEALWANWRPSGKSKETPKTWLAPDTGEEQVSGILHCVDNLAHGHTTAHHCFAVAQRLGIDSRLCLHIDDAKAFIEESVETVPQFDFIWLDGLLDFASAFCSGFKGHMKHGDRVSDIVASADSWGQGIDKLLDAIWPRLAPGGLLLLHSTLTNSTVRRWVEGEDGRGPPGGAVLSLFEPLKRFQNSCTMIQRRPEGWAGEPIFSALP